LTKELLQAHKVGQVNRTHSKDDIKPWVKM